VSREQTETLRFKIGKEGENMVEEEKLYDWKNRSINNQSES